MSSSSVRAILISLLAASALAAQETPPTVTVPADTVEGTAQRQEQVDMAAPPPAPNADPLTLQEAIALAMKKNFDLQIEGYTVEVAREALNIAKADFLPTLSGRTDRTLIRGTRLIETDEGNTIAIPSDSNSTSYTTQVEQPIPQTGGSIAVSGTVSRTSTAEPPFRSNVGASISQPLLGGAGGVIARAPIERSRLGLGIAFVNYRSRVLNVIRDTENAYYDLVAARETLRIRQLSLELAQRLLEENQARRATGLATDLDVAAAEVGLANARRALIQAEQTVRNSEDRLLSLINASDLDARPGPVAFGEYSGGAPSFAYSYKAARDNYPDTLSAEERIKQLEIDVAVARRNRLPTLNLNASIGYNTNDTSYADAIRNLPDDPSDRRQVSLVYNIPWGLRAERARYRSAVATLNQQKLRLEQLELQLLVNVRTAVRAVETNLASVKIAEQATQLAARQYDLQKARFDAGLATSRLVLEAQEDLENARFNELNAKAELWSAIAELRRLEGSSIEQFGVQLPQ